MTIEAFENRDKQADLAVRLFNDYCSGRELTIKMKGASNKKGIVIGLNKHLAFKSDNQISPCYADKRLIDQATIQRAYDIVYTVAFKVNNSQKPVMVPFELFLKENDGSYSYGRKNTTGLYHPYKMS